MSGHLREVVVHKNRNLGLNLIFPCCELYFQLQTIPKDEEKQIIEDNVRQVITNKNILDLHIKYNIFVVQLYLNSKLWSSLFGDNDNERIDLKYVYPRLT